MRYFCLDEVVCGWEEVCVYCCVGIVVCFCDCGLYGMCVFVCCFCVEGVVFVWVFDVLFC